MLKNTPPSSINHGRQGYVDIIKGWAMLTIIIFHCTQTCISNYASSLLGNPWNVPVFFIIAGFFLKEESLSNPVLFLRGKFKRLYLPATIIYSICILLHNGFVRIGWYPLGGIHPYTGTPFSEFRLKETCIALAKVLAAGGSGELAMGAMWFIYSLLYAFVGIVILHWLLGFLFKNANSRFYATTVCLLLLSSASCVLSQNYGLTVSRFSTSVTAMFLIWWGMIINRKWRVQYDKNWGFAIACIVFVHCILMGKTSMALAKNDYQDLIQLVVGSTAAIYIWGFIGKKIEMTFIGRFLSLLGRESLYLMAFHIIGFFICNSLLVKVGVFAIGDDKGLYTYQIGNNYLLLIVYVFFAISTSFVILYTYRGLKCLAVKIVNTYIHTS